MQLLFRQLPVNEMERPPTQRDQFDNDDVELVDALVREAIQNSLDAGVDSPTRAVRVSFDIKRISGRERSEVLRLLQADQLNKHLRATNLPELDESVDMTTLAVEDFGTTGLTGEWASWDEKPFCDFWRRMGRSHKSGQSLGRWGLGKLVFSSSSKARVFLGLTIREADAQALLMGQAVLTHHALPGGPRLDSHGFYAISGTDNLQLPQRNPEAIVAFKQLFGLTRKHEPGLSIVVPALRENITLDRIAQGVVRNYFFPILFGRLEVRVGENVINDSSFVQMAEKLDAARFSGGQLAAFIQEMKLARDPEFCPPVMLAPDWQKKDMESVIKDQLDVLRTRFNDGEMVMVRAPVLMKRKNGEELPSYIDAFLKRASEDHQSLFVRHAIVLNAEHKHFKARKTFGALIADDGAVSEFLGDAENPAHTGWSASAEKVAGKWRSASDRLKDIRRLLRDLHNLLVSAVETVEKDALVDIFSLPAEDGSRSPSPKGGDSKAPDIPPVAGKPKSYRLTRLPDGFRLQEGTVVENDLPLFIRVRVAYDVLRGNPFRRHNAADFDFGKKAVQIDSRGALVSVIAANVLRVEVTQPTFTIDVRGFDPNRDLIIDPEKES